MTIQHPGVDDGHMRVCPKCRQYCFRRYPLGNEWVCGFCYGIGPDGKLIRKDPPRDIQLQDLHIRMMQHVRPEEGDIIVIRVVDSDPEQVSKAANWLQQRVPKGVTIVVTGPDVDVEVIKDAVRGR